MSKHEAIALAVFLGSGFFCLAVMASAEAWSKVRIAQAEAAACVCEEVSDE